MSIALPTDRMIEEVMVGQRSSLVFIIVHNLSSPHKAI